MRSNQNPTKNSSKYGSAKPSPPHPSFPKINGKTVNLNPAKTYNSPFLSMEHGSDKAMIKHPGYEDVVLEF